VDHINDRSIAGALGYHRILSGLAGFSEREGLALEQQAIAHAAMTVYSSQWAAEAARNAAPLAASKVYTIPFGANLEQPPPPPIDRRFPEGLVKLLFLGVKWEEKGGPIAYETLLQLKQRGVSAQLVVCGCDPPGSLNDPDMRREGFLDKNDPQQRLQLEEHLRTADLLVLPTRFEAYGIVFCEAAAYGLPVLATRTGGIPTIVREGETGFLFAPEEGGAAYADRIEELVRDPARWQAMRKAAWARYETVLNWDAFADAILKRVQEAGLIKSPR
jgi:glycosyltransferase involved in cell wall biosynthesis